MGSQNEKDISFREHFEERLRSVEKLEDARWKAHEEVHEMGQKAFDVAMARSDDKFDSVNKFREQVLEERSVFMRRDTYESDHKILEDKVATQQQWIDNMSGRLWAAGAGIVALCTAISLVLRFWGK